MSTAQQVPGKFTCLFSDVELRGTVTSIDGSTFDVAPDPNYQHFVSAPWWHTVHCETYSTSCRDSPEWDADNGVMPRVDDGGTTRVIQVGDHIVVRGAWVYDNVIHNDEAQNNPDVQFYRGTLLTWRIKTELHPYIPSTIRLVAAPSAGQPNEQTLTLVAPRYTEVYGDTHGLGGTVWNTVLGVADHVVKETLSTSVSVTWSLDAPPPPQGATPGVTHQLAFTEDTHADTGARTSYSTSLGSSGLTIQATLTGSDILNPGRFHATYRVFWQPRMGAQIASFYASESVALVRFGGPPFPDPPSNSLDGSLHRNWALTQSVDDARSRLRDKLGQAADARARQSNLTFAQSYAGMAVHLIASGGSIGLVTGPQADNLKSLDWTAHRDHALARLEDPNAILPALGLVMQLSAMEDALWQRIAAKPASVLHIVFTSESVYLAQRGGYQNAVRNDPSPSTHLRWAESVSLDAVRDDLCEKYTLQYDRLHAISTPSDLASFYASITIRLNAFGVDFGSDPANSSDLNLHQQWAQHAGLQELKDQTTLRVKRLFAALRA